jgi:endonuclease/exonuclease/phosphatase family metal-dependent hydrolase
MSTTFTAMTWNVENFFPVGNASGPTTKAVYGKKLAYLAKTITAVAPDVLALQEVGGPSCLADLQNKLGGPYKYSAISQYPDIRGIRVALLSQRRLRAITHTHTFPPGAIPDAPDPNGTLLTSMGRGALAATVTIAGTNLQVMTAHLKSKLLTYPGGRRFPKDEDERARGAGYALFRRAAEAVAIRATLNASMSGNPNPTILLGDMNDEPTAITTDLLQGPPDTSSGTPDKGDDVRLNNLADYLPFKHHYSRLFKGGTELIDHILVSQELLPRVRQVDSLAHDITSITEKLSSRRDATIPDHAPLFARIELT